MANTEIILFSIYTWLCVAAADNCGTGITLTGLPDGLADHYEDCYRGQGCHGKYSRFWLVWSGVDNDGNHFGCERDDYRCDDQNKALVNNSWGIINFTEVGNVLAKCKTGCPSAPTWPERSHPSTPGWPSTSFNDMEWEITSASRARFGGDSTVSVSSRCCKRKAQYCDDCDYNTCTQLISGCTSITSYQRSCCVETNVGWLNSCGCKQEMVVCEETDDVSFGTRPHTAYVPNTLLLIFYMTAHVFSLS